MDKIFVLINAMIDDICFRNFCEKHPQKYEIIIIQISHLIFWMVQTVKYFIYDFSFTFLFFFISARSAPSLTGPFCIYVEYLDANKTMDKVGISILNIWMWRKCEAKFRNPWYHSPHCS